MITVLFIAVNFYYIALSLIQGKFSEFTPHFGLEDDK